MDQWKVSDILLTLLSPTSYMLEAQHIKFQFCVTKWSLLRREKVRLSTKLVVIEKLGKKHFFRKLNAKLIIDQLLHEKTSYKNRQKFCPYLIPEYVTENVIEKTSKNRIKATPSLSNATFFHWNFAYMWRDANLVTNFRLLTYKQKLQK